MDKPQRRKNRAGEIKTVYLLLLVPLSRPKLYGLKLLYVELSFRDGNARNLRVAHVSERDRLPCEISRVITFHWKSFSSLQCHISLLLDIFCMDNGENVSTSFCSAAKVQTFRWTQVVPSRSTSTGCK